MSTDKKQYVYRLMKAKCSCGSKDFKQNLNLPLDHGVAFQGDDSPLMTANDHVANEHILSFGRCSSPINPGGTAESVLAGMIVPVIGLGALLGKMVAGCKCEPMTLVPWINVDEDYFIDGAPALTIKSKLSCFYGGVIEIVLEKDDDSQDDDGNKDEGDKEERKDAKKQLPSEVQEKIESYCDDEALDSQSAAEAALEQERKETDEFIKNAFGNYEIPMEINFN